tara:strand:- start:364 stop:711 length:348 start_codon:yes stop_codon:yes gene_type:complete
MKVACIKDQGKSAAYPTHYIGFEFIYLKSKKEKILLFENRLAIRGIWLNDKQIADMVQTLIDANIKYTASREVLFHVGDQIIIESYKHRGLGTYDIDGGLMQTPDFDRSLKIVKA